MASAICLPSCFCNCGRAASASTTRGSAPRPTTFAPGRYDVCTTSNGSRWCSHIHRNATLDEHELTRLLHSASHRRAAQQRRLRLPQRAYAATRPGVSTSSTLSGFWPIAPSSSRTAAATCCLSIERCVECAAGYFPCSCRDVRYRRAFLRPDSRSTRDQLER